MSFRQRWDGPAAKWVVGAAAVAVVLAASLVIALVRSGGPRTPAEAYGAPRFVDVTASSGIDHTYSGRAPFFEGGGLAAFDCSGDGLDEVYIAGGESPAALYLNQSERGSAPVFARADRPQLELDRVTGAYPIDIDGDLITDLVVLRAGENVVFRGKGDCVFERANELWSIDGGAEWTVGFSATWHESEPFPTLAFGNYLKLTDLTNERDLCEPNVLLRPEGRSYGNVVRLEPAWCTLSLLFSDWNRDGIADLRVTNDAQYNRDGEEQMWKVFGDEPVAYARDDGWNRVRIFGMGIASYDVTGDGYPEVLLTNMADNKLQTLTDDPSTPSYTDIAIRRGVTAHRPYTGDSTLPSTSWHAEFQDVNNDGFMDLFIAKGNVDAMPNYAAIDPNNLLLGQPDGSFVEGGVDAGLVHAGRTRGAVLVDLNGDGLVDLIEVNREEPVRVWQNLGTSDEGGWVAVSLERHSGVNSSAVGAVIEVRVGDRIMTREVTVGGGHASGELGPFHFGLGQSRTAEVNVTWPDGTASGWIRVTSGSVMVLSDSTAGG